MRHFVTFDGIRGMLAIIVMLGHLIENENLWIPLHRFYLAVDFFFLLSGFVIYKSYNKLMSTIDNPISYFIKTRIIRLYPMILIGTIFGALISVGQVFVANSVGIDTVFQATVFGLLLLPISPYTDGSGGYGFPLNGVVWSLFYEVGVNIIWVIILPFVSKRSAALILGISFAWIWYVAAMNGSLHYGADFRDFFEGSSRVVFSFSAGMVLAHLKYRPFTVRPEAILLALISLLAVPAFEGDRLYDAICVSLLFPALLVAAADVQPTHFRKTWIWAGAISYPLYLLHMPILRVGHWASARIGLEGPMLWMFLAGEAIIIIGISHLALRLYDEPIRKWLRSIVFGSNVPVRS